jgi:hypothetical protein
VARSLQDFGDMVCCALLAAAFLLFVVMLGPRMLQMLALIDAMSG